MKMKMVTVLIAVLCLQCHNASAQKISGDQLETLLESYNAASAQFMNLYGCGHILDAPAYALKRAQNLTLDALLMLNEENEQALGKEVMKEMRATYKIVEGHWAENTLNQMLSKLSKQLERREIRYNVSVVSLEEINAFATVGGNIFVTTGLLDFVESNDELAFILGHELAHVDQYHTLRRYKKLALTASVTDLMNLEQIKSIATNLDLTFNAPFDQIDEYEADQYGVTIAKKAGYNTKRFPDFFKKMAQYQTKDLLGKLKSTHPFAEDRLKCLGEYINK